MKLTGSKIREEIKILSAQLSAMGDEFTDSLNYFDNETKPDPKSIADKILSLEKKLGIWQAAQKHYNVAVSFDFNERTISLQEAINIVGGFARVSKLWKVASG